MSEEARRVRFSITDRCIACGTCLAVCREGCISGGAPPFVIRQSYCTRCGLCAQRCPVRAIKPLPVGAGPQTQKERM